MAKQASITGTMPGIYSHIQYVNATASAISVTDNEIVGLSGVGANKIFAAVAYAGAYGNADIGSIAIGETGSFIISGAIKVKKDAVAFLAPEPVYWDNVNKYAVKLAAAVSSDFFCLGTCEKAALSTDTWVYLSLNVGPLAFNIGAP